LQGGCGQRPDRGIAAGSLVAVRIGVVRCCHKSVFGTGGKPAGVCENKLGKTRKPDGFLRKVVGFLPVVSSLFTGCFSTGKKDKSPAPSQRKGRSIRLKSCSEGISSCGCFFSNAAQK
jgi:hypothetical protein